MKNRADYADRRRAKRSQQNDAYEAKMDITSKVITSKKDGTKRTAIHAWRTSKRVGLVVLDAISYKRVTTKDGAEYMQFICTIKTQFSLSKVSGLYNEAKGILWIPDLRLVISAKEKYFKVIASKK